MLKHLVAILIKTQEYVLLAVAAVVPTSPRTLKYSSLIPDGDDAMRNAPGQLPHLVSYSGDNRGR